MTTAQNIIIRLKAFDHMLLDDAARDILNTIGRTGAEAKGPIPLPTAIDKCIVNRSTRVYGSSKEQFEIRVYKRVIMITQHNPQTINALMSLDLPAGVNVEIKLKGDNDA